LTTIVVVLSDRPAENAKDEVEHKEGADNDEADEVDPWPRVAVNVVDLTTSDINTRPIRPQNDNE